MQEDSEKVRKELEMPNLPLVKFVVDIQKIEQEEKERESRHWGTRDRTTQRSQSGILLKRVTQALQRAAKIIRAKIAQAGFLLRFLH